MEGLRDVEVAGRRHAGEPTGGGLGARGVERLALSSREVAVRLGIELGVGAQEYTLGHRGAGHAGGASHLRVDDRLQCGEQFGLGPRDREPALLGGALHDQVDHVVLPLLQQEVDRIRLQGQRQVCLARHEVQRACVPRARLARREVDRSEVDLAALTGRDMMHEARVETLVHQLLPPVTGLTREPGVERLGR